MKTPTAKLYTGKPGRPPAVRTLCRQIIAAVIAADLVDAGMVGHRMPASAVRRYANELAADIRDRLEEADLHIIPGQIKREFSLLSGEPAHAATSLAPMVGAKETTKEK